MKTDINMTGCYDICSSPDGGGYCVVLIWRRSVASPIFDTRDAADKWARKRGGTRCLRG